MDNKQLFHSYPFHQEYQTNNICIVQEEVDFIRLALKNMEHRILVG
jgi:hypothetical protein